MNATSHRQNRKGLVAAIAGIGMMFGLSGAAKADFVLTLEDTTTPGAIVISDENAAFPGVPGFTVVPEAPGTFGTPGTVSYSGFVGGFLVGFTVGTYDGGFGEVLHLSNMTVSGTGDLEMRLSVTDLVASAPTAHFSNAISITSLNTGSTLSYSAYVDDANGLLAETDQIGATMASAGVVTALGTSGVVDINSSANGVYSMTQVVNLSSAGGTSSFGAIVATPEPGIVALLGLGLVAMTITRRRNADNG